MIPLTTSKKPAASGLESTKQIASFEDLSFPPLTVFEPDPLEFHDRRPAMPFTFLALIVMAAITIATLFRDITAAPLDTYGRCLQSHLEGMRGLDSTSPEEKRWIAETVCKKVQ